MVMIFLFSLLFLFLHSNLSSHWMRIMQIVFVLIKTFIETILKLCSSQIIISNTVYIQTIKFKLFFRQKYSNYIKPTESFLNILYSNIENLVGFVRGCEAKEKCRNILRMPIN